MDHDRGRSVVADAGGFAGFLDPVVVVPGAFDRAWAGSVSAGGQLLAGDLGVDLGMASVQSSGGNVRRPGGGTADQAQGLGEGDAVGVEVGGRGGLGGQRAIAWWTIR